MQISGEILVDTFPLPSACLCHFVSESPFDLRRAGPKDRASAAGPVDLVPQCEAKSDREGRIKKHRGRNARLDIVEIRDEEVRRPRRRISSLFS